MGHLARIYVALLLFRFNNQSQKPNLPTFPMLGLALVYLVFICGWFEQDVWSINFAKYTEVISHTSNSSARV